MDALAVAALPVLTAALQQTQGLDLSFPAANAGGGAFEDFFGPACSVRPESRFLVYEYSTEYWCYDRR